MTKFSGIAPNASPALTDYLIGVTSGNVDDRVTIQNLVNLILKSNLLSGPYKFSVYRNAAFTSSTSPTVIPFDTKIFDTGTNIDVVTNKGRFTAPVAGFYIFMAGAGNDVATNTIMYVDFNKNGALVQHGNVMTPTVANTRCVNMHIMQLAAGDYIEAAYVGGNGSSMAIGQSNCWFHGALLFGT